MSKRRLFYILSFMLVGLLTSLWGASSWTVDTQTDWNTGYFWGIQSYRSPGDAFPGVNEGQMNQVGYWHFDNLVGNTADASGNGHTAVPYGTITRGEPGVRGSGCFYYDAINDFVKVSDASDLDNSKEMTWLFWINLDTLTGDPQAVLSKRDTIDVNEAYCFAVWNGDRMFIDIESSDDRFWTNTVFNQDQWYHVAIVFDGNEIAANRVKVYINGVLDVIGAETADSLANHPSHLFFGRMGPTDPRLFNGWIDEVMIYNSAFSPILVANHYNIPFYQTGVHDFGAPLVDWDSLIVDISLANPGDTVFAAVLVSDNNVTLKDADTIPIFMNGRNSFPLPTLDNSRFMIVAFLFNLVDPPDIGGNNPILHDFTIMPVASDFTILDIWSDLPYTDGAAFDYEANWRQEHNVYVELVNDGPYPVNNLFMYLNSFHTCGSRIEFENIASIAVGETVLVVFTISEPSCTGLDSMYIDFGATWMGYDHINVASLTGDNDLMIWVEQEAHVIIETTFVDPATAPYAPFVTRTQDFDIIVVVSNSGEENVSSLGIELTSSSIWGIASNILLPVQYVYDLDGGETDTLVYSIIADDAIGGMLGNDEMFEAWVYYSRGQNTQLPVDSIYYWDNFELIDIQNPPSLTILDIYAQGGLSPYNTWLNSWNTVNVDVVISNAFGDYAIADFFDIYRSVLTIWSSEVLGIGGIEAPSAAFLTLPAGATDTLTFTLWAIGPTEQTVVDVCDTTHYHDGNWASQVEPVASPVWACFDNIFNIDVIEPISEIIWPIAGMPWHCDSIVIQAHDNYSGVDSVMIYLMRTDGRYWDGVCCWTWTPTFFYATYRPASNDWVVYLPICPDGSTTENYNIYSQAVDVAGNWEQSPYRVPHGDFAWVHIVEMWSSLPWQNCDTCYDYRVEWDYEADWNQAHYCSVLIWNSNPWPCYDVEINLYSIWMNTAITTPYIIHYLPADAAVWAYFDVIEVPSSVKDSIYAHITGGIDSLYMERVAEQITEGGNDLLIMVQEPSLLEMLTCYADSADAPVRNGFDSVYVTRGQNFTVHTSFSNFGIDPFHDGQDVVCNLRMQLVSRGTSCFSSVVPFGPQDFYCLDDRYYFDFEVTADYCVGHMGTHDERLVLELVEATEDNQLAGVCSTVYYDTLEWLGIQYPPTLDIVAIYPNIPWLNSWNNIDVHVILQNHCCDYATADSLQTYPHNLVIYTPDTTVVSGVAGIGAPRYVATDEIPECQVDTLIYQLFADHPSYEGWVGVQNTSYFHDKNWPAQTYPVTAPVREFWISPIFGIDVTPPTTDIYFPFIPKHQTFPASCSIYTYDAISGVDTARVYYAIKDPWGRFWNSVSWNWGLNWLNPVLDIPNNYWHFDFPAPTVNGKYTVYAFCYDIAGNMGAQDTFWFIWDNCSPETYIIYPGPEFYSYDGECPEYHWDGTIKIWAHDTACGTEDVAGVKGVWVSIRDTLTGRYWTGSDWSAHVWPWRATTRIAGTDTFIYTGYTDHTSNVVLSLYSYGRDSVNNFGGEDTMEYLVYDVTDPVTIFFPPYLFEDLWGPLTWPGFIGAVTHDSITRIDSTQIMIYDQLGGRYYDPLGWTEDENWIRARWNFAPGESLAYEYHFPWTYPWIPTASTYYRVWGRGIDDVCNTEPSPDTWNQFWFYWDANLPCVEDRLPASGATYFPGAIWSRDTVKIYAYDCLDEPFDSLDSVVIVISRYSDDFYWDGFIWTPMYTYLHCAPLIDDSIWFYAHDFVFDDEDDYQIRVYAWDAVGNRTTIWYAFTISSDVFALRARSAPSVITIGETFTVTCSVFNVDGLDTTFFGPIELVPYPSTGVTILDTAPFIFEGIGSFNVQCDVPLHDLLIHCATYYPAPETLTTWSTPPVQVEGPFDSTIEILALYDNPGDQGDTLVLIHDRMANDPFHPDADTTSWILLYYKYFRLNGFWAEVESLPPADACSLKVTCNESFNARCFKVMGVVFSPLMGLDTIWSEPVCATPEDNVRPMDITDLDIFRVGGNIQLIWPEVRWGIGWLQEINPEVNIFYYIYRYTYPYDNPAVPYDSTDDTTWWDFAAVGDYGNNYFYHVVAVDHNYNMSGISNRVGEVDYQSAPGFCGLGVPFDMPGITQCDDLDGFLPYVGITSFARYTGGRTWTQWASAVPGFNNFGIFPPHESMLFSSNYTGAVTLCGDVPESLDVTFNLNFIDDWNAMLLPLHHPAGKASDLYGGIPNCTGVAQMLPGGFWQQLLITEEGDTLFNFNTHPGYPYMVWMTAAGVWPEYGPVRQAAPSGETGDHQFNSPTLLYGRVENIDGSAPEGITFNAYIKGRPEEMLTEVTPGCGYQNGLFGIQAGNLTTIWEAGEVLHIEITNTSTGEILVLERKLNQSPTIELGKLAFTVAVAANQLPTQFALHQNYPNPFNPVTYLRYDVPRETHVQLKIYNVLGSEVATLVDNSKEAGYHKAMWDGTDSDGEPVPGGIYFCKMYSKDYSATLKLMLMK
ncbi:T9SS type A sorting domain-containing protein [bacterium]|nr:T9SS type A sorting domain-containing protein [bacterium]